MRESKIKRARRSDGPDSHSINICFQIQPPSLHGEFTRQHTAIHSSVSHAPARVADPAAFLSSCSLFLFFFFLCAPSRCKSMGLKNTLNVHPASGFQPWEAKYSEMAQAMGQDPSQQIYVPYNATDKMYNEKWMEIAMAPLEAGGVDFWWLDWQQGEQWIAEARLNPTQMLNYIFYSNPIHWANNGKRPAILHRWGGLGNHRYQAGFSGDVIPSWNSLAWQPYFTAVQWSHKCPELTCTSAGCSSVLSLPFSARIARKMARMAHPERMIAASKACFHSSRQPAHEWLNSGCARLCVVKERAKSECKRRCRIGRREKKKVRPARERGRLWNNSGWNRRVRFAIWEHWRVASREREKAAAADAMRLQRKKGELSFVSRPDRLKKGGMPECKGTHPRREGEKREKRKERERVFVCVCVGCVFARSTVPFAFFFLLLREWNFE